MGGFEQFIPILLIFGIMYFLIIRPQIQEKQEHDALLASLVKDQWVVTQGGLYGTIVTVNENTVVLEIADKTRVTLEKRSVTRRVSDEEKKK